MGFLVCTEAAETLSELVIVGLGVVTRLSTNTLEPPVTLATELSVDLALDLFLISKSCLPTSWYACKNGVFSGIVPTNFRRAISSVMVR